MSTTERAGRLTLAEKEKILSEAERLIKKPASWTTGRWKCPVFKMTPDGKQFVRDDDGELVPEYDIFNRPVSQYCIEGAVNQAAINVLGDRRAGNLGVTTESPEMTDRLGLNEIAMRLYKDEYDIDTAMEYNDDVGDHAGVLKILREGLADVRKRLKR